MEAYTTEDEQLAAIKKWFQENSRWIVMAVGVFLLVFFGKKFIENQQIQKSQAVFSSYQEVTELRSKFLDLPEETSEENRTTSLNAYLKALDELKDTSSQHQLTELAVLSAAAVFVNEKDYDAAETELRWLLDKGVADEIQDLVNLRLGQVLLQKSQYDEAASILEGIVGEDHGYQQRVLELLGDVYVLQGKKAKALEVYTQSMAKMSATSSNTALLWKIDDLAEAK